MRRASMSDISIEISRQQINVTSMFGERIADPDWLFTDSHGHEHRFVGGATEIPTISWVKTGTEWGGDEYESFEYDVGEYRCVKCDDVVEPHWNTDFSPRYIPGPADVKVLKEEGQYRLTYYLRSGEVDELMAVPPEERESVARKITSAREPDEFQSRDPV